MFKKNKNGTCQRNYGFNRQNWMEVNEIFLQPLKECKYMDKSYKHVEDRRPQITYDNIVLHPEGSKISKTQPYCFGMYSAAVKLRRKGRRSFP